MGITYRVAAIMHHAGNGIPALSATIGHTKSEPELADAERESWERIAVISVRCFSSKRRFYRDYRAFTAPYIHPAPSGHSVVCKPVVISPHYVLGSMVRSWHCLSPG